MSAEYSEDMDPFQQPNDTHRAQETGGDNDAGDADAGNHDQDEHQDPSANLHRQPSQTPSIGIPARLTREPYATDADIAEIEIIDAQKTSDGATSSFIAYVIRSGTSEAKRRYSEFEAFRDAMVKLFPTLIVPPIPSKHTLGDYAAKQSKAKEDATIIARRKRMLQVFLNRIAKHPTLSKSEVFRKFLDGRYPWAEILHSPPLSLLPKNNLKAPVQNPADPSASPSYLALPLPASTSQLRHPNQRFLDSEAFTNRFANHLSGSMEKVNRRLLKRWTESSGDYAELGAVLNGFSLSESGALSSAIERTGQAADSTFMATGQMLQDWEKVFTEPLNEYIRFSSILQKLLKWRHLKHLQYELAQDALEAKKLQLEELERVEAEAHRLDRALERGGAGLVNNAGQVSGGGIRATQADGLRDSVGANGVYGTRSRPVSEVEGRPSLSGDTEGWTSTSASASPEPQPTSTTLASTPHVGPPYPPSGARPTSPHRRGASTSYGFLGALSHTFHSVMDVDPEATRRNNIGKLRDSISQLEEALQLTAQDLRYASSAIQADLDRFQREKVKDIRDMMISLAKTHREWCRVNLEHWQEAREEINRMEPPANMPESSLARAHRTDGTSSRKPSSASIPADRSTGQGAGAQHGRHASGAGAGAGAGASAVGASAGSAPAAESDSGYTVGA